MSDMKKNKFQQETRTEETEEVDEAWNPTPEAFKAFTVRDEELATSNVTMLLTGRKFPISIKELKGCTLHSSDVVERVLAAGVKSGRILETKGEYTLA